MASSATSRDNPILVKTIFSWSDQGAFTGDMTSIRLKIPTNGKRWFNGKKINEDYDENNFGYLKDKSLESDSSDSESESEEDPKDAKPLSKVSEPTKEPVNLRD